MRTLIFGARGQLGRDLVEVFAAEGPVAGFDLPELDIADSEQVEASVKAFGPDVLINAAAYTNVEAAEDDAAGAFRANVEGAAVAARAAHSAAIPVVYYSTDYVFGGHKRVPYVEEDAVAPIGVYAQSKADGEVWVRELTKKHFILRTAWLYGPTGNCFPKKILELAGKYPELKVVEDEVGSPTHTRDLAEATLAVVQRAAFGTYHAVNGGKCSRYELAKAVLELAGVSTPIVPCASSEFPAKASRPLYSVLATEKLRRESGYLFKNWKDALVEFMARLV